VVSQVANVRSIVNELAVMPITPITQRSNDTFITGKMRASLLDAKDLSASAFKVVTERGVIYLMGRREPARGARATSIARGVTVCARWCGFLKCERRRSGAPECKPRACAVTDTNPEPAPEGGK
jgi:hypothetical protein